ncbi:MAG: hypothetical protein AB8G96_15205 [Phycisphaerales bacterium]
MTPTPMPNARIFVCSLAAIATTATVAVAGGGDDASTATPIDAIPFSDSGDTTQLTDQFDAVCPFSGSTSPDAWYQYVAADQAILDITLCDSAYDTKVYVLDEGFNEVACNDDACGGTFRSELTTPALDAGTYYIVVDGWSGEFGAYNVAIAAGEPCGVECPNGAIAEGEPCDDTGGVDTNGGCNSSPFVIDSFACGQTICGIAWVNAGQRDTDWFEIPVDGEDRELTINVTAGFEGQLAVFPFTVECRSIITPPFLDFGACNPDSISVPVDAGEIPWIIMLPSFDALLTCSDEPGPVSNDYVLTLASDDAPLPPCPELGDANGDGMVDFADLLVVIANFGPCP